MWQLTVKLTSSSEATSFLEELDQRNELATGAVQVRRYPDDGQAVMQSAERTPLAGLTAWASGFASARLSLTEERYGGDEYV
jgi:hypothetical protein